MLSAELFSLPSLQVMSLSNSPLFFSWVTDWAGKNGEMWRIKSNSPYVFFFFFISHTHSNNSLCTLRSKSWIPFVVSKSYILRGGNWGKFSRYWCITKSDLVTGCVSTFLLPCLPRVHYAPVLVLHTWYWVVNNLDKRNWFSRKRGWSKQ